MSLATLTIDSNPILEESELPANEFLEIPSTDILLLDRSQINKELISTEFNKNNHPASIQEVDSALSLLDQLEDKKWHCIVIAIDQITISLSQLFKAIPSNNLNTPVIILTDEYQRDTALKYIKDGAQEVIAVGELEYLVFSIQKKIKQTNLSAKIEAQEKLIHNIQNSYHNLIDNLPLPHAIILDGVILSSNQAFKELFSMKTEHINEEFSFLDLVAQEDLGAVKKVFRKLSNTKSENAVHESLLFKSLDNKTYAGTLYLLKTIVDNEPALQIIIQTQTKQQVSELSGATASKLLTSDHFTQLLNQAINSKKTNAYYSLGLFEISSYDTLKKQIGIPRTETLMNSVAEFIADFTSQDVRIARINSQLFSMLVISNSPDECVKKMTNIQGAIDATPTQSDEQMFQLVSNVGIVHFSGNITSASQALSLADAACTISRNNQQNNIHIYDPKIDEKSLQSEELEQITQIKLALENDEFSLAYQPIIHIKDSPTPIYEVLLRMKSSEGEVILPTEFLPTAKQGHLCSDIDRWVISQSITLIRTSNQKTLQLFINISEASIQDLSFIAWLKTNDSNYLQRMVFEISEQTVIDLPAEVLLFTQTCEQLGIDICLEHFSNNPDIQGKLELLAVKYYKINGTFTNHLSTNRKHQLVINNISKEAKRLNIRTIACYVQDADSLAVLWQEGIDYIQGNYLQSPIPDLNYQFNHF